MTTIGSLFAGYGGLEMGAQAVWPDAQLAWYSEIDKGALKILRHHHPDVPNLGDVTTVDWATVPRVDILTGGSPCQDLSHAGKRQGMTEGTRSNLWVAMREAIAQLRPGLVIWENVRGAYSAAADSELEPCAGCVGDGPGVHLRALGRVLGDLSDLGYVGGWHGLRAADIGAPHGRFRVFVVAYPASDTGRVGDRDGGAAALAADLGYEWSRSARDGRAGSPHGNLLPTPRATDGTKGGPGQRGSSGDLMLPSAVAQMLPTPSARDYKDHTIRREPHRPDDVDTLARALTDVPCALLPTPAASRAGGTSEQYLDRLEAADGSRRTNCSNLDLVAPALAGQWGQYAAAIARWEAVLGRPAPAPTRASRKGNPQLAPAFVEWMMGLPAGHVTDAPGITRNEALKALGNGVVPQQAEAAIRWLLARIEVAA